MSPHRRQESFRYEFRIPLDTSYFISKWNGKEHRSKTGKGVLLDISLGGLRMQTALDLPSACELTFDFVLAEKQLQTQGEIVWKRQIGAEYVYGIDFIHEEQDPELLQALKLHAKL